MKELNAQNLKTTASNLARFINDNKILITQQTLTRLAQRDRFPKDRQDIRVYVGRKVSERTRDLDGVLKPRSQANRQLNQLSGSQLFKDVNKFFRIAKHRPFDYDRPWFFQPVRGVGNVRLLLDAVKFTYQMTAQRYASAANKMRGLVNPSQLLILRKEPDESTELAVLSSEQDLSPQVEFYIVNPSNWAARAEGASVEMWRTDGLMYHAAYLARQRFPEIDINFTYTNLNTVDRPKYLNLSLPLAHRGMVPVVRLSLRGGRTSRVRFSRPGRNIRRYGPRGAPWPKP